MIVVVLGAGAWGTAVAAHAARRHAVRLWTRSAEHAEAMRGARRNARYLPDTDLPPALSVTSDLAEALAGVSPHDGLVVIAAPVAGLAPVLDMLPDPLPELAPVATGQTRNFYDLDYRDLGRQSYSPLRHACQAAWTGFASVLQQHWAAQGTL
ncbi:MAG TPA: hypothetical protein PK929_15945, partial [Quisquiliibacterium sp.]|nr:hypothetical protein [Quisquiliibacterium sp.]